MDGEWSEELKRFDERTTKRRVRAKEQDEKAQEMIREDDVHRAATSRPNSEGPG